MNVVINVGEYTPKESDILVFTGGEWKLLNKNTLLDKVVKKINDDEKKLYTLEKEVNELKTKVKKLGEVMKGVITNDR